MECAICLLKGQLDGCLCRDSNPRGSMHQLDQISAHTIVQRVASYRPHIVVVLERLQLVNSHKQTLPLNDDSMRLFVE